MKKYNYLAIAAALALSVSCYDRDLNDYEHPNMGFTLPKQVRTVVSGTDRIYVGVSVGGLRQPDLSEWGTFVLDESLLKGTGLELLPPSYYKLSNGNTFHIRRPSIAIADVAVDFTKDFYNDPLCREMHYALPFRLIATSVSDGSSKYGSIREGGETSVVAIKYISEFSGTYYLLGEKTELDKDGNALGPAVKYASNNEVDLISCPTRYLETVGALSVRYSGIAGLQSGSLLLSVGKAAGQPFYNVAINQGDGMNTINHLSGRYVLEGDYSFFSGDRKAPQIELEYLYESAGKKFKVKEKLVLRRYPEEDLRVETF